MTTKNISRGLTQVTFDTKPFGKVSLLFMVTNNCKMSYMECLSDYSAEYLNPIKENLIQFIKKTQPRTIFVHVVGEDVRDWIMKNFEYVYCVHAPIRDYSVESGRAPQYHILIVNPTFKRIIDAGIHKQGVKVNKRNKKLK